jgi:hypothetical protein
MNNNSGRSLTGVTSGGGGSVGNVTATLSNLNISNVNISNVGSANLEYINISNIHVNEVSNASINNLGFSNINVNNVNNASIDYLTLASVVANSVAATITNLTIQNAQMQTFSVRTPNQGVIIVQDSNTPGLSTLAQDVLFGMSSISSIISYGLSTVYSPYGISSLSSIVSYGLSTLARQPAPGVSSLSSIVGYGLSSTQYISSNTINHTFIRSSIGGADIRPGLDTFTDALAKIDTVFERLISKPPAPVLWLNGEGNKSNIIGANLLSLTFSNLQQYYFNGLFVPDVIYTEFSLSYSNNVRPTNNPYSNTNLFTVRTEPRANNPGANWLAGINSNITATTFVLSISDISGDNAFIGSNEENRYYNQYDLYNFSNHAFSDFNPYLFKMRWVNNAIYPSTDNYFTTYINFGENGILSDTGAVQ